MSQKNSKTRFSDRVEDYIRYRPEYPSELLQFMTSRLALSQEHLIVDIGSGTGKLAKLFLENGNKVYCVEPNKAMREGAESILSCVPGFVSIAGSAEETTLPDHSMNFAVSGQAFHWFDPKRARSEFERVLREPGWACLIWNIRKNSSECMQDYEGFLQKHGTDYKEIGLGIERTKPVEAFFNQKKFELFSCPHQQLFNFESLKGFLLSASYAPKPGAVGYEAMINELNDFFERYSNEGVLRFEYDTEMFYGKLT